MTPSQSPNLFKKHLDTSSSNHLRRILHNQPLQTIPAGHHLRLKILEQTRDLPMRLLIRFPIILAPGANRPLGAIVPSPALLSLVRSQRCIGLFVDLLEIVFHLDNVWVLRSVDDNAQLVEKVGVGFRLGGFGLFLGAKGFFEIFPIVVVEVVLDVKVLAAIVDDRAFGIGNFVVRVTEGLDFVVDVGDFFECVFILRDLGHRRVSAFMCAFADNAGLLLQGRGRYLNRKMHDGIVEKEESKALIKEILMRFSLYIPKI